MAKEENVITNKIIDHLRDANWMVLRINSGMKGRTRFYTWWPGAIDDSPKTLEAEDYIAWEDNRPPFHSGVSDLLALRGGVALCVEVKTKTGSTSPMQDRFLSMADKAGAFTIVPKGFNDFLEQYHNLGIGE